MAQVREVDQERFQKVIEQELADLTKRYGTKSLGRKEQMRASLTRGVIIGLTCSQVLVQGEDFLIESQMNGTGNNEE